MRHTSVILAALAIAGCYDSAHYFRTDGSTTPDGIGPTIPTGCPGPAETQHLGEFSYPSVDILVVVDNSMSMAEEQANLAENFPLLIHTLLDPEVDPVTGRPSHTPVSDMHIGVISTDMGTGGYTVETCSDPVDGDDGILQHDPNPSMPGCDSVYPGFLSYSSDEPDPGAIDWLATSFGCIAVLGTDGCGFEQPLNASRKALVDHRGGANAGFLRSDSLLAILFVTDEEDCSVAEGNEDLFNPFDSGLGHLNLRCYNHPYMLERIERFIDSFRSLREDPGMLVLSFLVGVPRSITCEGYGDAIDGCLDDPNMIERVDPETMTTLVPSCTTGTGVAYPPRRFVQIAQRFGNQALVQSICTDDFRPAIGGLAAKIQKSFQGSSEELEPVDTETPPWDPCACLADCRIVEMLAGLESCGALGKPCWEPDGAGTGCASPAVTSDGYQHTLCEIPQTGTTLTPCSAPTPPGCDNPLVTHSVTGEGWYYMAPGWKDISGTIHSDPMIGFTVGSEPEDGSSVYLICCV